LNNDVAFGYRFMARFDRHGSPDESFGRAGFAQMTEGHPAGNLDAAIDGSGRIVLVRSRFGWPEGDSELQTRALSVAARRDGTDEPGGRGEIAAVVVVKPGCWRYSARFTRHVQKGAGSWVSRVADARSAARSARLVATAASVDATCAVEGSNRFCAGIPTVAASLTAVVSRTGPGIIPGRSTFRPTVHKSLPSVELEQFGRLTLPGERLGR
jgi:hypothetical protein